MKEALLLCTLAAPLFRPLYIVCRHGLGLRKRLPSPLALTTFLVAAAVAAVAVVVAVVVAAAVVAVVVAVVFDDVEGLPCCGPRVRVRVRERGGRGACCLRSAGPSLSLLLCCKLRKQ